VPSQPKVVPVGSRSLERFRPLLGEEYAEIEQVAERARITFAGRAVWHLNSTPRGGGVAEMLRALLPYARGAGVDVRWIALRESEEFFTVTKRLHNHLHGDAGDGGRLDESARRAYEGALHANSEVLAPMMQRGDVVYLHDPQTAGMIPALCDRGMKIVWRCHVGADRANEIVRGAWEFLRPYVGRADACVFSRREYVWDGLDAQRVWVMPPAIDPFSPKNQDLEPSVTAAILKQIGLAADGPAVAPCFRRGDDSPGRVERVAAIAQEEPVPEGARVVAQVSRWDRLKDPGGLLAMLARHLEDPSVHLVLAGPEIGSISDDPEGAAVYGEVVETWRGLDRESRRRAHLVNLPMYDLDENGVMVNAIQRRADVVVQKSIAEGFGLTLSEAMWKRRPVVASRVGGLQDQVIDGETGILVDDPHDLAACAGAIGRILADPRTARAMGEAGHRRVLENYLAVLRLREYVDLLTALIA
jgi:trehalose synthase